MIGYQMDPRALVPASLAFAGLGNPGLVDHLIVGPVHLYEQINRKRTPIAAVRAGAVCHQAFATSFDFGKRAHEGRYSAALKRRKGFRNFYRCTVFVAS